MTICNVLRQPKAMAHPMTFSRYMLVLKVLKVYLRKEGEIKIKIRLVDRLNYRNILHND